MLGRENISKERIGVWGSKYDFYIIPKNNEIYGQYIGVHDRLPKLYYGNDLVLELSKIKSSKHRYQFQNMQDVVDYFNSFALAGSYLYNEHPHETRQDRLVHGTK